MLNFFNYIFRGKKKNVVQMKNDEPLFLTTSGLNFYIEDLIQNAEKYLYLVAPYVKINDRLKELLHVKKKAGVKIILICRKNELNHDVSSITSTVIDRKNLHAKCFLSENSIVVCSMNLYEFSQVNNDEMGFYFSKASSFSMYQKIEAEVMRLLGDISNLNTEELTSAHENCFLKKGEKYSPEILDKHFDFDYKKISGIKLAKNGDICLFLYDNSKYNNKEIDGITYFQGQNTGGAKQQLLYGNKNLFCTYPKNITNIYLFRNAIYCGKHVLCKEPYYENNKLIFPLTIAK